MPVYKVPAVEHIDSPEKDEKRQPTLYVPMKSDWLKQISVGDKVEILVKGKIRGTHADESENFSRSEVELALDSVEYYNDGIDKVIRDADKDT